jgi:hypothetical protein
MTHEFRDPNTGEFLLSITGITPSPNITFFQPAGREVMKITREGITVNPEVETDDAAKAVLKALESMIGFRDIAVWNDAIEAAAKEVGRVLREDGRWQADVIRGLKK